MTIPVVLYRAKYWEWHLQLSILPDCPDSYPTPKSMCAPHTMGRRCRSPLLPEPAAFLPPSLGESLLSTLSNHLSPALSGSPIIISLMSSGYHYSQDEGLSSNNFCGKACQRTSLEADKHQGRKNDVENKYNSVSILSDSFTEIKLKVVLQHQ